MKAFNFIYRLFLVLTAMFLLLRGHAFGSDVFVVRNLSFTGGKYTQPASVRDPYLGSPRTFELVARTGIQWDVDLLCGYYNDFCFFWNNQVDGKTSQAAFKYVSWDFESGLATRYLDFYYSHKSEHVLEEERPQKTYPIQDSIMIRLKFIDNPRHRVGDYF